MSTLKIKLNCENIRIVGIGDILVPTFQEFFGYISETKPKNVEYYEEYYEKLAEYVEPLKNVVQNVF